MLKKTLCAVVGLLAALNANATPVEQQRIIFDQARQAIDHKDWPRYKALSAQVKDYVLYPYLEYYALQANLTVDDASRVSKFIANYPDSPLAADLRSSFLFEAGKRQAWPSFRKFYQPTTDEALRCYDVQARIADQGPTKALNNEAMDIWLTPHSLPDECNRLVNDMTARGVISKDDVWLRIQYSMEANQVSLAQYLARQLSPADQKRVDYWVDMHRQPATMLNDKKLPSDNTISRRTLIHGLQRLARNDVGMAIAHWDAIKTRYKFSASELQDVAKRIGLAAAYQHRADAGQWLSQVKDAFANDAVREWRVRSALREQNWDGVLAQIDNLSPDQQENLDWHYWKARALEATGQREASVTAYKRVADRRSYYGFLAAERLGIKPQMNHAPMTAMDDGLSRRAGISAIARAQELYAIGLTGQARRELRNTITYPSREKARFAAWQAHEWGWHDLANAILEKTQPRNAAKNEDDLTIRFPTPFKNQVARNARAQSLDPAWIYGVMRQESVFMPQAESPVGAKGLMQLMPTTGRQTAKELRTKLKNIADLFIPDTNIQLGSAYLRKVRDRFRGNQILATAAYNAGPSRVNEWLPDARPLPADVWIDTIPFKETRGYAQAVTAFTTIFQWRLDRPVKPLAERMTPIAPNGNIALAPSYGNDEASNL